MPGHWHYMTLELSLEDQLVRPMINPEATLTREAAHRQIQELLDRLAGLDEHQFGGPATIWRRGAKDDTVSTARFIWTIFECTRLTCPATFAAVMEEWAGILRHAGLTVDVARYPDS